MKGTAKGKKVISVRKRTAQITFHLKKWISCISTSLIQGNLTLNEHFNIIERIGHRLTWENLKRIGLFYDFKNSYSPSSQRKGRSVQLVNVASVEKRLRNVHIDILSSLKLKMFLLFLFFAFVPDSQNSLAITYYLLRSFWGGSIAVRCPLMDITVWMQSGYFLDSIPLHGTVEWEHLQPHVEVKPVLFF